MNLVALSGELEPLYWKITQQDFCDYYFFIYDWLLQKENTQVFFAMENSEVLGLMLIYRNKIVQLRGSPEAVEFLLTNLRLKQVELQAPLGCEKQVLTHFPSFKLKSTVSLLKMHASEENLKSSVEPQKLDATDAEDIAALMRDVDPEMWGDVTPENIRQLFASELELWLGIKQAGKLASFGYALLTPKVSHVTWIATSRNHRNKGYATTIVSALTRECLKKTPQVIIYVSEDNSTAKRIYSMVGFKPHKSYFYLRT